MVDRSRELEAALGGSYKRIEENERDTAIVQRRAVRVRRALAAGQVITRDDLIVVRPATPGAVTPPEVGLLVGRAAARALAVDEAVSWTVIAS
jgi:N-acetylneuraminate synthase